MCSVFSSLLDSAGKWQNVTKNRLPGLGPVAVGCPAKIATPPMTSLFLLLSLLAPGALQTAQAATVLPKFEDYRVNQRYQGKNANPVLTRDDRQFRTRIREGAREKVNFAGHYVLTVWGCGASCLMGVVIDGRTGRVYWIPFTICCWPLDVLEPLEFHLDSRLIVFTGSRNEKGQGVYYYKFNGSRFVLLQAIGREEHAP